MKSALFDAGVLEAGVTLDDLTCLHVITSVK
jgi:hypothetical protein